MTKRIRSLDVYICSALQYQLGAAETFDELESSSTFFLRVWSKPFAAVQIHAIWEEARPEEAVRDVIRRIFPDGDIQYWSSCEDLESAQHHWNMCLSEAVHCREISATNMFGAVKLFKPELWKKRATGKLTRRYPGDEDTDSETEPTDGGFVGL